MKTFSSFNKYIEKSIIDNWNLDALTDYKGITLQYHDVARKIEKLHILFEHSGVKPGDKIGLCGRNSAHWAVAFFATLTYGAVAVPIQNEFKPEQIYNIVNHSESKLLFVGDYVAKEINPAEMPTLEGIINLPDYSLMLSRSDKLTYAREHLNEIFGRRFPRAFRSEDVCYHPDEAEELAIINYTSGTTGFSKGVMLPYRAIWGNLDFCLDAIGTRIAQGSSVLSILPMAHMYGMAVEFIFPFVHGCHLFFLTRLPSPAIIAQAFADIHPAIVISVPLVVEKIIRKMVFPKIQNNKVRLLWNMPVINKKVKERICQMVMQAFGGNAYEVMTGGAALNQEIEAFLKSIDFPITAGYGATECAPLITYSDWHDFQPGSCGTPVSHMEVKILSADPENIPGEIVARGTNVMLGYYNEPEATAAAFDGEWFKTGDYGYIDSEGFLFIRGREKNLIILSNGKNVSPEELEDKLSRIEYVKEVLVYEENGFITAEMFLNEEDFPDARQRIKGDIDEFNRKMPLFKNIGKYKIRDDEFPKTTTLKIVRKYMQK